MRINGIETAMIERPVHPPPPLREDCWNEEATYTLIEAWGDRHIMLNRGNLRQKHWQEVADTVNAHHGTTKKSRRTDVQCKNRIDTLKKKYKSEKVRISSTSGQTLTSSNWPFYYRLDSLIGIPSSSSSLSKKRKKKKKKPYDYEEDPVPVQIPISTRFGKEKRSVRTIGGGGVDDDSFFRKNYFAVAAAAAAAAAKTDSESSRSSTERSRKRKKKNEDVDGVKELARAIGKLGEIYERVEEAKQRQFIELEKQRMEFMKSLEFERMQFYMDTQIQVEKIKRSSKSKRAAENDCYLSLSMREKA